MRFLFLLLAFLSAAANAAPTLPYDEAADADAAVHRALAEASARKVPALIIFGANWCEDCRALDKSLHTSANAALIGKSFVVVKVDVGRFDRNLALDAAYGDPIKAGIPAAVIVSPDNRVLYSTRAGELADARTMSDAGIYDFFVAAAAKAGPSH
ncbi:MAG: thioredoxin family protein [Proteobacteria bacterium]|nr:thioredoxin family protein [Pseudomonadota bacterium]